MIQMEKTKYANLMQGLLKEYDDLEKGEKLLFERKREIQATIAEIRALKKGLRSKKLDLNQ